MTDYQEATETVYALGNAWEQFKQVNDHRLNELERKGSADPLYDEHLRRINAHMDQQKSRMDRLETAMARPAMSAAEYPHHTRNNEYKQAFCTYLRKGMDAGLEALHTKALSVGTPQDGGYFVTEELSDRVARRIFDSSPMRALASVQIISTDSLDVIEDAGDMGAAWVAETGAVSDTTTPDVGKKTIVVHEMYAQPKATQKLLDDAAIDVEAWVADKVADRFARMESTAFINGTGTGQPKGILTYTAGTAFGQVQQINSGTSATVTGDGLIRLFYALQEEYTRNATFLMNRSTIQSVRLLKESTTGQYLWQPGLAAGAPDTLLGVPVAQAADMPIAAANSLSVAIADFTQAYLIVERIGLRILRDPFTEKPFVKFYTTRRVGGEVINTDAIKLLRLAA
ncbi:MAG: phage major capsid protein [Alphaproteobacteria bacterium]|nr:MAG: phage major capsid protein [Alphaproteobacteria bacterium]